MESYNGQTFAIWLDKSEGDLEAMYNILAYYRQFKRNYHLDLVRGMLYAVMCEKLFQDVRKALEE